jgi:phospholipid transport system substrate-binding protein
MIDTKIICKGETMSLLFKMKWGNIPAVCVSFILVLFFVLTPLYTEAEQTPEQNIKTFNAALLQAMKKGDELGYAGRYKLLQPVIEDTFALSFMADASIGRYARTINKEQRRVYLKNYAQWTIATYAGRFDGYSGERFDVLSASKPVRGTVTVVSRLTKSDGDEIDFYYLLRDIEQKWRVVDIRITGVSQLALTRSQFINILKEKGFDGLISMLKEKTRGFSQGKGN